MQKGFDRLLPIPKTPRVYRPPPPPKPLSWVPRGQIGDPNYEARLEGFAKELLAIDAERKSKIKFSTRGWCYFLEGKIHKGEFDQCQISINDCRKIGFLPIDFVAEDQDITRHFIGIHAASDPGVRLKQIKEVVKEMLESLPPYTTDYWIGEKYYLMMCVEKGDLRNLFKPICDKYHVPIVSSKGWAPILLRANIASLSQWAEAKDLTPVLLLFYDHDPAGLKITDRFRKNLKDCERATGWSPDGLEIERFGLNKEDIDKYNLTWIENVRTGSGRESQDYDYIEKFGKRKCEANAIFKNDKTLKAGENICKRAIEKYYGSDALKRFKRKEKRSRRKLKEVYDDPIWQNLYERIDELKEQLAIKKTEQNKRAKRPVSEEEVEVTIDGEYYGLCPRCRTEFNYDDSHIGRLVRCRSCSLAMRLRGPSKKRQGPGRSGR